MKFRKDKDILRFIGISLGFILGGIIIFLYIKPVNVIAFIFLIIGGLIGLVIGFRVATKPKYDLIEDERSVRIREKAGYSAFVAILLIAGIISLLGMLKLSPLLTPSRELAQGFRDMLLLGFWIFILLRWYYNKKGDSI